MVAKLLQDGNVQNIDMLHWQFSTADIHYILKIKLPLQILQDRIIWYFDCSREYSINSGYYVALGKKNLSHLATSAGSSHQWSSIWKLKVPSEIRWCALFNLLSTMCNLMLKRVVADLRCILCGNLRELVLHALFLYLFVGMLLICEIYLIFLDLYCLIAFLVCGKYRTMCVQSFHQMSFICLFCLCGGFKGRGINFCMMGPFACSFSVTSCAQGAV